MKARAWAAAAACLALVSVSACGGSATDQGTLTLIAKGADNSDPLADPNAARLDLEIDDASGVLVQQSFPLPGPIEIDHAPLGAKRVFVLTTREPGGGLLKTGQSSPIDLVSGQHVVVTVVMQ